MKKTSYILFCLLMLSTIWSSAQEITFSKPQRLPTRITDYEIIGKVGNVILIHKWGERYNLLEGYSANTLKLKWTKEFDFGYKNMRVLKMVTLQKDLLVFYAAKQKKHTIVYGQRMTSDLQTLSEQVVLDSIPNKMATYGYDIDIDVSLNRKYIGVRRQNYNFTGLADVDLIVLNRQLERIQRKKMKPNDKHTIRENMLSNDGRYYIGLVHNQRILSSNADKIDRIHLFEFKAADEEPIEIVIEKGNKHLNDIAFRLDNKNNRIVIGGFYSNKQIDQTSGYFYAFVDLAKQQLNQPLYQPFSKAFLPKLEASMGLKGKSRVQNLVIKDLILRQDGGVLLLGESFHQNNQRVGFSSFGTSARTSYEEYINFYHEDIIALSIHPTGELFWETILQKKQFSEGDEGYFASFGVTNGRSFLRLLFNEEISYRTHLNSYQLKSDGEYAMKSVVNMRDSNFMVAPQFGKQLSFSEIVLPAFNSRNEFMVARIQF